MSTSIGALGLNFDGTVQVPSGRLQPGWFDLGPTAGELGSAVLLGHVSSYRGPGVFFQLRTLAPGDQVDVDLADGDAAQFTVDSVAQFSKQAVSGSAGLRITRLERTATGHLSWSSTTRPAATSPTWWCSRR